jgi:hypothetical protein
MHIAPKRLGPWPLEVKVVLFLVTTPTAVLVAHSVVGAHLFISPVILTVCCRLERSAQVA